jgi:hypothetical protein
MSAEEQVRETLRRQADAVRLSPDAWERIEERSRPRGLSRWQLTTLSAVAAAIVAVAAVLAVRVTAGDDAQQVAAGGGSTTVTEQGTTIPVPTTTTAPPPPSSTTATSEPPPTTGTVAPTTTVTTTAPTTETTAPPTTTSTTEPPPPAEPIVGPSDTLGWGSLGPITVGTTVQDLEAATGADFEESYAFEDGGCGYALSPSLPAGVSVMISGHEIERIEVGDLDAEGQPIDQPITTDDGLGTGSTEEEVLDTYGDRATVEDHPYDEDGHYLVVTPPPGVDREMLLIFETDGAKVTSFRSGFEPAVRAVEGCA